MVTMEDDPLKPVSMPVSATLQLSADAVALSWRGLDYHMRVKSAKSTLLHRLYEDKHILRRVSGSARSGELLAIMGPTGCGKTSLLNVLAARAPVGGKENACLEGSVLVNGSPRDDTSFRRISAYVLQDDRLFPHMTVQETLLIAAHFYLPSSLSLVEKEQLVEAVVHELGLVHARDTVIGDDKVRGVSGGERRRASIAVQLITNPSVLFLDEPTSGLDSFQAQSVMEAMKNMTTNGRLVIAVIHQPRSSIYDMFDRLLLLSEGSIMFAGPATEAVQYFISQGFICPRSFNPSDYFLDVLSPDNRSHELEASAAQRIATLGATWSSIPQLSDMEPIVSNSITRTRNHDFGFRRTIQNFRILCWRSFAEQSRDRTTLIIKHTVALFFGLLIGGIYSNTRHDQRGIQNRVGLLFLIVINQTFNPLFAVLNVFPREKIIVHRERAAYAYDSISYFLAKFFVEIPLNLSPTLLFGIVCFWLAGLNPKTFGYYVLILGYHNIIAVSLGLCLGSVAPTVEGASAVGTPIVIIMVLFGGFYINIAALPIVANWLPYLSFLRWTFEAMVINEFNGLEFSCADAGIGRCVATGEDVLELLSFGGHTPQHAIFGNSMILIGLLALLLISLELNRMKFLPLGFTGRHYKVLTAQ